MMRRIGAACLGLVIWSGILFLFSPPAWAIPSFARRYGVACSTCHDAWPHLNSTGWSFKMSGYRRLNGRDLEPTTKDIELAMGALSLPSIPPLAVTATVGFDLREDRRVSSDGTTATRTGSSLDVETVAVLVGTPLGRHLSAFLEFPLFETPAGDGPTGPAEANNTLGPDARQDITFETESPTFEMGKLQWNSLLPTGIAPLDSLNVVGGAYQLPLAFSAEANRLAVTPYLIYRRRAIDLILSLTPAEENDRLLRLGEPQIQFAVNGVLVPFGELTDLAKLEAVVLEYDLGLTNGSNNSSDSNTEKDLFGRVAMRWYGQKLGVFGYWSPDIYDDAQRAGGAPFSGRQLGNSFYSVGPDLTLDLRPFEIPVWLETQILFNRESDPTGFKKRFDWWGGFSQLYVQVIKPVVAYARYDWLQGNRFDDTGVGGSTPAVRPREWAVRHVVAAGVRDIEESAVRAHAARVGVPAGAPHHVGRIRCRVDNRNGVRPLVGHVDGFAVRRDGNPMRKLADLDLGEHLATRHIDDPHVL
jgi:hypothetical protein